ncbi:MAG: acylphosphatase [Candidatus Aenigmarchaeota archaeon]|nr:acylphosphatase [Candidatus Aenigmarchaeota archaeon]
MQVRSHVLIKGSVQGVFFRMNVQELAKQIHISGWVKNLPDGNVEAVFEGEEKEVESIISFCRKGPIGSKVGDVVVKNENFTGEFKDFKIIYQE